MHTQFVSLVAGSDVGKVPASKFGEMGAKRGGDGMWTSVILEKQITDERKKEDGVGCVRKEEWKIDFLPIFHEQMHLVKIYRPIDSLYKARDNIFS